MKLIPKYQQGTPNGVAPNGKYTLALVTPDLPYVMVPNPNLHQAEFRLDNRSKQEKQRLNQEGRKKAETQLWKEQRAKNFESFGNFMELAAPSTYVGQAMGHKLTGLPALATDVATPFAFGAALKGLRYAGKGLNYLVRMDMPRFGYTPTTKYYFKPGYAGMNNFNIGGSNTIDELSNTRKLFDLSPRELQAGVEINDKANSFKTIIPYSELDSKLNIKDSKRLFSTLEEHLGDEAIVLDNGIAFESPNEAKNTLGNLVKYLKLSNKTRSRGETPYSEQEIISMLNPERTGLKSGQMLESFYPGSHGVENWYDATVRLNPVKEQLRKIENVRKYLRTVFGRIKKEDALDLRYFNPKGRSGVVVPENLDELLSSDSSIMTIRHLLQELKNGRKYLLFNPTGYKNKLNHLGLRNSFRLKGNGDLNQLLLNNPDLINGLDIRETRLPGFMAIHDKSNRKLLATLKLLDTEEIAENLNRELTELNKEFAKYNVKINPFTFDETNVYLPDNMSGILYGNGGKIERIW